MENNLTIIKQPTRIESAGETEASSAEEQLARDNQPKATNCRWGGSFSSAIPFYDSQRQFRALLCLKKPPCRRQGCLLTVKVICPIHAEPVHPDRKETQKSLSKAYNQRDKAQEQYKILNDKIQLLHNELKNANITINKLKGELDTTKALVAKKPAEQKESLSNSKPLVKNNSKTTSTKTEKNVKKEQKEFELRFDIPALLRINIMNAMKRLGQPKHHFKPSDIQWDLGISGTIEYQKDTTNIQIDYLKSGKITKVFISDKTPGRKMTEILQLGNIDPSSSKYTVRVQPWLNAEIARQNNEAEIAGIEVIAR